VLQLPYSLPSRLRLPHSILAATAVQRLPRLRRLTRSSWPGGGMAKGTESRRGSGPQRRLATAGGAASRTTHRAGMSGLADAACSPIRWSPSARTAAYSSATIVPPI